MTIESKPTTLSRAAGHGRAAAPVRHVHLGLGNFFRAHQAVYTDLAPDAAEWGIAAFAGRSSALAENLSAQDGLYTVMRQDSSGSEFDVIGSVSKAHAGSDLQSWLDHLQAIETRLITLTVTEAGYQRDDGGGLEDRHPEVRRDIDALLCGSADVHTIPGRLVAGFAARRAADAGPISVIPCDNLTQNGPAVARVVADLAVRVDPALAAWIEDSVSYVSTMADRITPRTTTNDVATVAARTGLEDRCPVVTEPFSEWVLQGEFATGRPDWEHAGAIVVDDITPFEQRKVWLLNGAHSLLAYAGRIRGHRTVAEAIDDDSCRTWVEEWWGEASRHVDLPEHEIQDYRGALLERFSNVLIVHRLDQIAADGSVKLPARVLPVIARERSAGRLPLGALRILAAWVVCLRGTGPPVADPGRDVLAPLVTGRLAEAVRQLLTHLDPDIGADTAVTTVVVAQAEELSRT